MKKQIREENKKAIIKSVIAWILTILFLSLYALAQNANHEANCRFYQDCYDDPR